MANTAVIFGANNSGRILTPGGLLDYLGNPILPAQAGNGGKFLTTDGTTATWGVGGTSSGTKSSMFALTGSNGQIYYNTTYNMYFGWSGGASGRWWPIGIPDPKYGFVWAPEDILGADRIGSIDLSGNNGQLAGNLLNPGLCTVSQSAASGVSRMSQQLNSIQLGTMDLWIESIIAIPTLSNGSDNACHVFGLNDGSSYSATGACTDGVYFTLDPVNANWLTNTSSNSVLTSKTSSTAPSAGTFYRLSIFVEAGTQATFYVNGTAITTAHTTNLPTGAGRQTGVAWDVHKTLGAGALTMSVDNFAGWGAFNGARVA